MRKSADTASDIVSTATTPAAKKLPAGHRECPRCTAVENWGQSSWCPRCGYYPMLDDNRKDGTSWSDALLKDRAAAAHTSSETAFGPWVYGMLGGMAAIFAVTIGAKFVLADLEIPAGKWSWPQSGIGLAMMVVAHCFATRYAMKNDRRLNLFDAAICWVPIWQPTLFALPKGWLRVSMVLWGLTMVLCSVVITGGHNLNQVFEVDEKPLPKPNLLGKAIGAAAKATGGTKAASEDMEGTLKDFAGTAEDVQKAADGAEASGADGEAETEVGDGESTGAENEEAEMPALPEGAASFPTDQETLCSVFGYYKADDGKPSGVLLSYRDKGAPQHVASIAGTDMTPEAFQFLAMKVTGHECPSPACKTWEQAVWVQPVVQCRVRFSGIAADGSFQNPRIVSVVRATVAKASEAAAAASSAASKAAPRGRPAGSNAGSSPIQKSGSVGVRFNNSPAAKLPPKSSGSTTRPATSAKSGSSARIGAAGSRTQKK